MPNTDMAESASTRDRILRAAVELIAEVGSDRVRTRAVADRAGVNPALVHYHFGSMSALLREAVDAVLAGEAAAFVEALKGSPSARDVVQGLVAAIQGIGEPTPELMVAIDLLVRATRDPAARTRVRDSLAEFREQIHDRLDAARQRGEIGEQVDIAAASMMLAALVDGLGMHRLIDPELDVRPVVGLLTTALTSGADDDRVT